MTGTMQFYIYEGPVMSFNKCIKNKWKGRTYATTKDKALTNLKAQYKKEKGLTLTTSISLPGKLF